jgi:hypothetical protein
MKVAVADVQVQSLVANGSAVATIRRRHGHLGDLNVVNNRPLHCVGDDGCLSLASLAKNERAALDPFDCDALSGTCDVGAGERRVKL